MSGRGRALRIAARRAADAALLAAPHDAWISLSLADQLTVREGGAPDADVPALAAGVRALALRIARRAVRARKDPTP